MLFTLFNVQDLAGVNLHLYFAIGFVFAEPAVAREHVLLPMNWHRDLHAVKEPACTQTFVGMTD